MEMKINLCFFFFLSNAAKRVDLGEGIWGSCVRDVWGKQQLGVRNEENEVQGKHLHKI